jgi:RNA polymerase sigma-70 factor, ECF subfamily
MTLLSTSKPGPDHSAGQGIYSQRADSDLARAAGQDATAFAELYARYFKRVYGYHLLRTSNVEDAQDLTSQTFIAALESIHHFEDRGSFAAWLLGIAHHKLAMYYRGRRPQLNLEEAEGVPSFALHPEEVAHQHGLLRRVSQALRGITAERADALLLRTFGGLSAGEVAEVLGKSEAAVKMLAHRAIQDIRQRLQADRSVEEA